jgi:hypothetical protein
MKNLFFLLCGALFSFQAMSQLKTTTVCPPISVDLLDGKVNGMEPDFTQGQIKKALPCFTSEEPEEATSKCGGGIYYKDKDIYFFTARNYIEIGPKFKGKLSLPLMGASRGSLFKWLGHPIIKDVGWDAFTTSYGVLILYYSKANKVTKIQFSSETSATINLCQ